MRFGIAGVEISVPSQGLRRRVETDRAGRCRGGSDHRRVVEDVRQIVGDIGPAEVTFTGVGRLQGVGHRVTGANFGFVGRLGQLRRDRWLDQFDRGRHGLETRLVVVFVVITGVVVVGRPLRGCLVLDVHGSSVFHLRERTVLILPEGTVLCIVEGFILATGERTTAPVDFAGFFVTRKQRGGVVENRRLGHLIESLHLHGVGDGDIVRFGIVGDEISLPFQGLRRRVETDLAGRCRGGSDHRRVVEDVRQIVGEPGLGEVAHVGVGHRQGVGHRVTGANFGFVGRLGQLCRDRWQFGNDLCRGVLTRPVFDVAEVTPALGPVLRIGVQGPPMCARERLRERFDPTQYAI